MADVGGVTKEQREVNLAELEVQLSQQEMNRKSHNLRRKQIQAELIRIETNDAAAVKAIGLLQEQIAKLTAEINANG